MKALVIYDSVFGNTEKVARAMGEALAAHGETEVRRVSEVTADSLRGIGLLVLGSPTRAFRPLPSIKAFLAGIPANALAGVRVAAFDTRVSVEDANSAILRFMVRLFGYAAKPIADGLARKGGSPAAEPEGFFVGGSEGPLKEGELERAAAWAGQLDVAD